MSFKSLSSFVKFKNFSANAAASYGSIPHNNFVLLKTFSIAKESGIVILSSVMVIFDCDQLIYICTFPVEETYAKIQVFIM